MTICKRYVESSEYSEDKYHEITQHPNGYYYNYYDAQPNTCIRYRAMCIAGPFATLEEAQAMMKKHRPTARML